MESLISIVIVIIESTADQPLKLILDLNSC